MRNERLRLFLGSEGSSADPQPRDHVTVKLADVFPLLAHALANDRTWLRDFENEEIAVSADLYDLIRAYQHYHRPSA